MKTLLKSSGGIYVMVSKSFLRGTILGGSVFIHFIKVDIYYYSIAFLL